MGAFSIFFVRSYYRHRRTYRRTGAYALIYRSISFIYQRYDGTITSVGVRALRVKQDWNSIDGHVRMYVNLRSTKQGTQRQKICKIQPPLFADFQVGNGTKFNKFSSLLY